MFFFAPFVVAPMYYIIAIYFLAAVLPAIFLMRYVYRQDSIEQEPPYLLWSLVGKGVLAALAAIVLEVIGQTALDITMDPNDPNYVLCGAVFPQNINAEAGWDIATSSSVTDSELPI